MTWSSIFITPHHKGFGGKNNIPFWGKEHITLGKIEIHPQG